MARKPVPRVPDENPPPYQCGMCWYYEPIELEHGACYGTPPAAIVDGDGDMAFPRVVVFMDDRGCHLFRPRHTA